MMYDTLLVYISRCVFFSRHMALYKCVFIDWLIHQIIIFFFIFLVDGVLTAAVALFRNSSEQGNSGCWNINNLTNTHYSLMNFCQIELIWQLFIIIRRRRRILFYLSSDISGTTEDLKSKLCMSVNYRGGTRLIFDLVCFKEISQNK